VTDTGCLPARSDNEIGKIGPALRVAAQIASYFVVTLDCGPATAVVLRLISRGFCSQRCAPLDVDTTWTPILLFERKKDLSAAAQRLGGRSRDAGLAQQLNFQGLALFRFEVLAYDVRHPLLAAAPHGHTKLLYAWWNEEIVEVRVLSGNGPQIDLAVHLHGIRDADGQAVQINLQLGVGVWIQLSRIKGRDRC
jgi:hypothetical protein